MFTTVTFGDHGYKRFFVYYCYLGNPPDK